MSNEDKQRRRNNGLANVNFQIGLLIAVGGVVAIGVLGSVLSPNNIVQILGFCALITAALLNHLQSIRNAQQNAEQNEDSARNIEEVRQQATIAATKVEKVAEVLEVTTKKNEAQTAEIASVVKETKHLVNSNSLVQLKINQKSARRLAELLPNDEQVVKDRDAADKMVEDHEKAQAAATAEKNEDAKKIEDVTLVTVVNELPIQVQDKGRQEK